MASAAPNWADTSVRWLRGNHPSLTPASSVKSFNDLLLLALMKMKFRYMEMVEDRMFTEARWKSSLVQISNEWTKAHHEQMVTFLTDGGYKASVPAGLEKLKVPVTLADGTPGVEEIELEIDEVVDGLPAPLAQLSPAHELEEAIADAVLASDPRLGAW